MMMMMMVGVVESGAEKAAGQEGGQLRLGGELDFVVQVPLYLVHLCMCVAVM